MYIVDSHCDSIMRGANDGSSLVRKYNFSQRYRHLQFCAIFSASDGSDSDKSYDHAMNALGYFKKSLAMPENNIVQVRTYQDIENAFKNGKNAALLTIEGGGGCIKNSVDEFVKLYDNGARVFGLSWRNTPLASSAFMREGEEDTGLTAFGREIIEKGNELGMIFDVSHLSDKSFWDVAAIAKKPIVATHSNFRALCDCTRNLTDEMTKEIIGRDGMIGLNLYPGFVDEDVSKQTVERLFDHLDHCLALGGENHIGFGGDIDGTSGHYPAPLTEKTSIHDQLIESMLKHNYSEAFVNKVAGENYLRFLKKYL